MSERQIEETGPDVNIAIARGLAKLKLPREAVVVDVIDAGSRGILGIGSRPARVRILVRELEEPELAAEAAEEAQAQTQPETSEAAPAPAAAPPTPTAPAADELTTQPQADEYDDEEDARSGGAALEELLEKMQIDAKVHIYRAEPGEPGERTPWVLEIQGRDLGVLIGRRGDTLNSIQYVTRLIASRDLQHRVNIIVDVEGYKARRAKQLRKLADRLADQAIQVEHTVEMEPMSPYERRIVHITLRNRDDVTTQSVGEGDQRRVTIIPT